MMRYTYFFKLPGKPCEFVEGNDRATFTVRAERASEEHPEATVTVCDRLSDTMIYERNMWGNSIGGHCNVKLTGMFD